MSMACWFLYPVDINPFMSRMAYIASRGVVTSYACLSAAGESTFKHLSMCLMSCAMMTWPLQLRESH
jgi:hypothetical protein